MNSSENAPTLQQCIAFNKASILTALRDAGISSVVLSYAGAGDSGDFMGIEFAPPSKPACLVTIQSMTGSYDQPTSQWTSTVSEKQVPISEALEDLLWGVVELTNHSGWENSEGGGGTLTIQVDGSTCQLNHYDYIVNEVHSDHEI